MMYKNSLNVENGFIRMCHFCQLTNLKSKESFSSEKINENILKKFVKKTNYEVHFMLILYINAKAATL